jgi:arylsulfatase A-like enzyme
MKDHPNIIFILMDGVRVRNLSTYGYEKPTSPNITQIAKEGALFNSAYSCINFTEPSITTILSGKYPSSHGILNHAEQVSKSEMQALNSNSRLRFLQEILRTKRYTTSSMDWLGRWHKRGFDYYSGFPDTKNESLEMIKTNLRKANNYIPFKTVKKVMLKPIRKIWYMSRYPLRGEAKMFTDIAIDLIQKNKDRPIFQFIN